MTAIVDVQAPEPPLDRAARPAAPPADGPDARPTTPIHLRYVGHATVLVDAPGLRLLTDPFLRERLGPLRRHGPAPVPAALGRIDIVAISHAHPDHFDRDSLGGLRGDPLVIVPRGLGGSVRRAGLRAREVRVGERVSVAPGWTITAVPARHWRWPGALRAGAIGYLVEGPGRIGIYFAGDTARFPAMAELAGRVDLALLPVGSWGPHLTPGHLSPRAAARVAQDVGARVAVPIHWGTLYPSGLDRVLGRRLTGPADRFAEALAREAPGIDVQRLDPGAAALIRL